jgi:hypothetical protein
VLSQASRRLFLIFWCNKEKSFVSSFDHHSVSAQILSIGQDQSLHFKISLMSGLRRYSYLLSVGVAGLGALCKKTRTE